MAIVQEHALESGDHKLEQQAHLYPGTKLSSLFVNEDGKQYTHDPVDASPPPYIDDCKKSLLNLGPPLSNHGITCSKRYLNNLQVCRL